MLNIVLNLYCLSKLCLYNLDIYLFNVYPLLLINFILVDFGYPHPSRRIFSLQNVLNQH